ncbi:hypothetical protein [Methylobacterium brachythecii]|uniref:O-antigen ligase like membrane protein n=1 Tax=Methylobacterium brachythecii TaxID=1176177 RepID=A0A7W6F818_9HYPH|nr:hypothetical protein [Methylobacterium brachythecii]MBB3903935.1 hypothetical protein [Methylobacterium brachythecii]GLS42682.1 hypothetical protein GCM10007884_06670 [Methylobacterium brachythecii]
MTFEWIGLATLIVGLLGLVQSHRLAITACIAATLLGAAAASILTALGSANLPPAHVLLGFLMLIALRRPFAGRILEAYAWPQPGFWLLMTGLYATLAAVFMPRLFAGTSYVFTIARTDLGPGLLLTQLAPVSGNLSQTAYFVADVLCFGVFYAFARDRKCHGWIVQAILIGGCLNIAFAALDYATFFTGTADFLAFMRNATYRMLDTAEVVGFKRLVGSFPEASAFATATLTFFAFTFSLWLDGYRSRIVGGLSLLLFLALVASTSTTAYAGLSVYLALVYLGSLGLLLYGRVGPARLAFLAFSPIVALILVGTINLHDTLTASISDILQQLIFMKGSTASAMERASWNSQALINFYDSYGLGVGPGSARASNIVIATLATIGIFGAFTYATFLVTCLVAPRFERDPDRRIVRKAAASACAALFISGCIAGTTIDLGLLFFICAALAATPVDLEAPAQGPVRLAVARRPVLPQRAHGPASPA